MANRPSYPGTPRWVNAIIATAVLLVQTQTISSFADIAADPTTSGDDLRALGSTLVHSVGGTVVFVVVLVLNVYKPRGITRYGWRKQHDEQRCKQQVGEPGFGNTQ